MATLEELRARLAALEGQGGADRSTRLQQLEAARRGTAGDIRDVLGWRAGASMFGAAAERSALDDAIARERTALAMGDRSRQSQMRDLRGDIEYLAEQEQLRAEAEANRQAGLDLTEGRMTDVLEDPYTTAALERTQQLMDEPAMNEAALNALYTRLADMGAATETANRDMMAADLAARGMSVSDPSAQAAMRSMTEDRQLQNQANMRDLLIQQAMTNWPQGMQGAGQLANIRGAQQAQAQVPANMAAQQYWSTYNEPRSQYRVTPQGIREIGGRTYRTPQVSVPTQQQFYQPQRQADYGSAWNPPAPTYEKRGEDPWRDPGQAQNTRRRGMY